MNGHYLHNQQKPSKLFAFEWKSSAKNDRILGKSEPHQDGRCEHCGGVIIKVIVVE